MPRGPSPVWKQRKEPILDAHVLASINQAGGKYDPETGHYAVIRYTGCDTRERAAEIKRALHRSAMYLHRHKIASVGMHAEIIREGDTFTVEYRAVDKTMARKYVVEKYGTDPNKYPYFARRKGN